MLELYLNGKWLRLFPIGAKGTVGQSVLLGERVDWDSNPALAKNPLSQYPYLTIFTISEKSEGKDGTYYTLSDHSGNSITVPVSSSSYLFDVQEYLNWNALYQNEKISRKQRKIEQLEGHVALLKDILIKQGIRIVTEAQAKDLGL